MRTQKRYQDRVNHDRWLVSYADLITLLFAFFVVMYSVSSLDERKYRVMSSSVINAFSKPGSFLYSPTFIPSIENPSLNITPPKNSGIPNANKTESDLGSQQEQALVQERDRMKGLARNISDVLAPFIREGEINVVQTKHGISIDISDSVLFSSGDANLTTQSSQVLISLAPILANDIHSIEVEGFTDNQPIKNGLFPSNWELSAVRASSVVRLFVDHGIAGDRLTAIGQGPKMPVADNNTAEGRAKNRRVNITILATLPEQKELIPLSDIR